MLTRITNAALVAALIGCLVLTGALWRQSAKLTTLEADNARLSRNLALREDQMALAQGAAIVAQKEWARMAVASAKYETIRDAFRKGNFDAPLPDDFRDLMACLVRRATGRTAHDCA